MDYVEVCIRVADKMQSEILIAELAAAGFESFEEDGNILKGYIPADSFDNAGLKNLMLQYNVVAEIQTIKQQNWNAQWENDFQPVKVGDFCTIRADFHEPDILAEYEIIITPKMSFGTGHHATTRLMIQQMQQIDFRGKKVLDFGTGTGVLAILAEKMGASEITAIDTDEWSYENTVENAGRNGAGKIYVKRGSLELVAGATYDVILANINRHILLQYMQGMVKLMQPGGIILMSGILEEDEQITISEAEKVFLKPVATLKEEKWICIKLHV